MLPFVKQLRQFQRAPLLLGGALGCFLLVFGLGYLGRTQANSRLMAKHLEQRLQSQETKMKALLTDSVFLGGLAANGLTEAERAAYYAEPFNLLLYEHDTATGEPHLILWTNNDVVPPNQPDFITGEMRSEHINVRDYDYLQLLHSFGFDSGHYTVVGLLPIRLKYPVENRFLHESFPLANQLEGYVTLSRDTTDAPVRNLDGEVLIRLKSLEVPNENPYGKPSMALLVLGIGMALLGLSRYARFLAVREGQLAGLAFLAFSFVGLRLLVPLLVGWKDFSWKTVNSAHWLMQSPVDLLFNAILLLWLALYVYRRVRIAVPPKAGPNRIWWPLLALYTGAGLLLFWLSIFYQAVFSSGARLQKQFLLVADWGGLLSMFTLALLQFGVFLLIYKLAQAAQGLGASKGQKNWALGWSALLLGGLALLAHEPFAAFLLPVFAVGLLWGMEQFVKENKGTAVWIATWLIYFSAFSASQLYLHGRASELRFRLEFAEQLASERDERFETLFGEMEENLLRDRFVLNNVGSAFKNNSLLLDLLNDRFLDSRFFSRYEYEAFCFTDSRIPLIGNTRRYAELEADFNLGIDVGNSGNLRFRSDPDSAYAYIARLCYENKQGFHLGTVFLSFTPKPLLKSNVYIELLSETDGHWQELLSDVEFAVYKLGNNRRQEGGNFPRNPDTTWAQPEGWGESVTFRKSDKEYLVYRAQNEHLTVVRTDAEERIRPFSLFSFLFCINLAVLTLMLGLNRWLMFLPGLFAWRSGGGLSLRGQIQAAMVAVILLAFVTIAAVTLLYNQRQLTNYHRSRLERKVAGANQTARNLLAFYHFDLYNQSQIRELVNSIANSERLVINLYDREGQLLQTSKEAFFDRKLVSARMNPLAYHMMEEKEEMLYVQTERIGSYAYQAAYAPLKNDQGLVMAYLCIPYDSNENRVARQDNAELLGTLLNVYVLLLLIAGGVALTVANSVTRPLAAVAEKLRLVKLGRRNEPLDWKNDDEIGTLISRYNEMIGQLEENSAQLARTQKELAWREMAKQVAHEIKNPLTPMKLNLQLLERAFQGDPEQGKAMFRRVSASLIEQIDNLAHIASEFSNFAKMPQAQNERLHLNALVGSVCELFRDMQNADMQVTILQEDVFVWVDKNQLMRVLNNLIKNAEQAIPDTRRGLIEVSLSRSDNSVHLAVKDNGSGISADMIDKVFLPNFTTKSSGMGLGLAMSKSIVEAADGRIWFETETGVGTTFYLDFPLLTA